MRQVSGVIIISKGVSLQTLESLNNTNNEPLIATNVLSAHKLQLCYYIHFLSIGKDSKPLIPSRYGLSITTAII